MDTLICLLNLYKYIYLLKILNIILYICIINNNDLIYFFLYYYTCQYLILNKYIELITLIKI